jgi:hypothetical protein
MKKNKKFSSNVTDTASSVDISPEALANLSDKLKLDLSKPSHFVKQSSRDRNNAKKPNEPQNGPQERSIGRSPKANMDQAKKPASRNEKVTKTPNSRIKRPHTSVPGQKVSSAKAPNGESIPTTNPYEKSSKGTRNSEVPQLTVSNQSKASRKSNVFSRDTRLSADTKETPSAPSLLDEILALGGTKEDLQLVEDIDSDEDIVGESQYPRGQKSKEKNNEKTVYRPSGPADIGSYSKSYKSSSSR